MLYDGLQHLPDVVNVLSGTNIHMAESLQLPPHSPSPVRALESAWSSTSVSFPGPQDPEECLQCSRRAFAQDTSAPDHAVRASRVTSVGAVEGFLPSMFLSAAKAGKDKHINQPFSCWSLTCEGTHQFCDLLLCRNELQAQLCWCKSGQTPLKKVEMPPVYTRVSS